MTQEDTLELRRDAEQEPSLAPTLMTRGLA